MSSHTKVLEQPIQNRALLQGHLRGKVREFGHVPDIIYVRHGVGRHILVHILATPHVKGLLQHF